MKYIFPIFLLACLGQIARPVEVIAGEGTAPESLTFTTSDGKVFEKVKVKRAEPDGIIIETDSGIEKVSFNLLPTNLQEKFGFDPAKASAFASQSKQAASIRAQQAAAVEAATQKAVAIEATTAELAAKASRVRGRVLQVMPDGLLVEARPYIPRAGGLASVGGGGNVYSPPDPNGRGRPKDIYGSFFISGHPSQSKLADGDPIDVNAYEDGTYAYTTIEGARRTLKKYSVVKAFEE